MMITGWIIFASVMSAWTVYHWKMHERSAVEGLRDTAGLHLTGYHTAYVTACFSWGYVIGLAARGLQ